MAKKSPEKLKSTLDLTAGSGVTSPFYQAWIERASAEPENIRKNYEYLKQLGFTDRKIAKRAVLLTLPLENIKGNLAFLTQIGVSINHILTCSELLAMNPKTLRQRYRGFCDLGLVSDRDALAALLRNRAVILYRKPKALKLKYEFLKGKGLSEHKITTNLMITGRSYNSLKSNWSNLKKIGLSDHQIITYAHLLSLRRETLLNNYVNLRRFFERSAILKMPPLLGLRRDSVEANVQFITFLHLSHNTNSLVWLTNTGTKRKKVVWLLKLLRQEGVTDPLVILRKLVQRYPKTIVFSIGKLESMKGKLQQIVRTLQDELP